MPWIYPAIIALITLSVGMLIERVLMKHDRSEPVAYAIIFQIIITLFSFLIASFMGKFYLPNDLTMIPRYIISAVLWAGSTLFSFQAMKRLGAGEVTILGTTGTVITVFLSVLFLHETINLSIIAGIIFILFSVVIIVTETVSFKSKAGVTYAILTALCAAFAVVNDSIILKTYEAFSYMTIMSFLPAIVLGIIYPKRIYQSKQLFKPRTFSLLMLFGLLYAIQGIAYYYSIELGAQLSQLSPLIKISTVLTVILTVIVLKERAYLLKKIIAAMLSTIGAILVG